MPNKKKTIYRSVIQIEVLSEEPIPDGMTLGDIIEEGDSGGFSLVHAYSVRNTKLVGIRAARKVMAQASDTEFFGMNDDGDDINDEDYIE
jgi:hypothetical protein